MDIVKKFKQVKWDPSRKVVDVQFYSTETGPDVFWSPRWKSKGGGSGGCNSYVLVENEQGDFTYEGKKVSLYSINGAGEIRWSVTLNELQYDLKNEKESWWNADEYGEKLKAARHFKLIPPQHE